MNLSPNFTLAELTLSQEAVRSGIDNTPNAEQIENGKQLCVHALQPIRDKLGKGIRASSGFRCVAVNAAIGGAKTSQHTEFKACDFTAQGMTVEELFRFILANGFQFDQIIQEFDDWVHISWNGDKNRNQVLRATKVDGKTHYEEITIEIDKELTSRQDA